MVKETKYYEVNLRTKEGNEKLYIKIDKDKKIEIAKESYDGAQATLSAICPELTSKEYFERIGKFEKINAGNSEDLELKIGNLE